MTDSTKLTTGVNVVVDGDGVEIEREYDTDQILLSWDEFGELMDWIGYVRKEPYDRAVEESSTLAEAMLRRIPPDTMDLGEVNETEMDVLSGDRRGDVVIGRDEAGDTFVGIVRRGNTPATNPAGGSGAGSTTYVAPIDVVGGTIDEERIAIEGTHVYEPQTRHYPGYDAVEDVGIRVDGDLRVLEYLEVVEVNR